MWAVWHQFATDTCQHMGGKRLKGKKTFFFLPQFCAFPARSLRTSKIRPVLMLFYQDGTKEPQLGR